MTDSEFNDLYVNWYSRAFHFACEYVMIEEDAENIVQDTFLRLYERKDFLDSSLNIIAYMFTSIKNGCLDFIHRSLSEDMLKEELQNEYVLSMKIKYDSLEILDTNFGNEKSIEIKLDEALQKLPERCREIFIMNKLQGVKQKQIAEKLNISVNTVESQMSIAYKKLYQALKDCLPLFFFIF
jgi:RNA polymerase sigma-70 factor (family 1)